MYLVISCSGFIGEDGVGGSCPSKMTGLNLPNNSPVLNSSAEHSTPATDSKHLRTLRDQLHSVLRSNPSRENGAFGGKSKLCV
jgi:hypothetical protein